MLDVVKLNVGEWIVSGVNLLDDSLCVLLDHPDVVSDCHGISLQIKAAKISLEDRAHSKSET